MIKYQLVKNKPLYYEFIRKLRNDERVQRGFIEVVNITQKQQEAYMKKYGDCFYICLLSETDKPVGYIGVINDDIRIATHPDYQNQGVGSFMIQEISKIFPDAQAKVKIDNDISMKLFKKAGFKIKYYLLEKDE